MTRFFYTYQFNVYRRDGTRCELSIPANTVGDAADEIKRRIPDAVNITHIGRKP